MPYIIRCHVKDTAAVKKAIRTEIIFRGDFAPWNEDADDRWLAGSSDQAPLTRQLLTAARRWVVACYDGAGGSCQPSRSGANRGEEWAMP